jgi:hypothetical protein
MRRIALFVEDHAHHQFLGALIQRLSDKHGVPVRLDWRNTRRGHGAVVKELKQYLRDLYQQPGELPDLVLVATDANCMGLAERTKMIGAVTEKVGVRIVCAIPDPHIERWLLVDSAAFKAVFGRGCDAPDQKCERARYKKMLIGAIRESGITPSLGGIEYAQDIVNEMDLDRVARNDDSLGRLLGDLDAVFREWAQ